MEDLKSYCTKYWGKYSLMGCDRQNPSEFPSVSDRLCLMLCFRRISWRTACRPHSDWLILINNTLNKSFQFYDGRSDFLEPYLNKYCSLKAVKAFVLEALFNPQSGCLNLSLLLVTVSSSTASSWSGCRWLNRQTPWMTQFLGSVIRRPVAQKTTPVKAAPLLVLTLSCSQMASPLSGSLFLPRPSWWIWCRAPTPP